MGEVKEERVYLVLGCFGGRIVEFSQQVWHSILGSPRFGNSTVRMYVSEDFIVLSFVE